MGSFATPYLILAIKNSGQKPIIYFAVVVLVIGISPLKWVRETLVVKKTPSNNPL